MKNVKYVFVIICLMVLFPVTTKAACSYERVAELSRISGNVNFDYSYDIDDYHRPIFTVYASNITNDIYITDSVSRKNVGSGEGNFVYTSSGRTINYDIYSNDNNCKGQKIMTQTVTLPYFNDYSRTEECESYPEFKYCDVWMNTSNLTVEKFLSEYDKYVDGLENNSSVINEIEANGIFTFISDNLILIIICIVCIGSIPFLVVWKRRLGI